MARGRARRWVIGAIAAVVVLGGVGVWFVYSGIFSVAATYPDSAPADWLLSTTMDNSVKRHARGIAVPALDDPAKIGMGLGHYREMCVECHGAPGVPIGVVGRGLNPAPPELTEAAGDWKPNELFWITKNGVRMSGMPAWGVTHSDEAIWAIVAFVQRLPTMTPAQYRALNREAPPLEQ
jgi:mono/diheme cytochrome c family protein